MKIGGTGGILETRGVASLFHRVLETEFPHFLAKFFETFRSDVNNIRLKTLDQPLPFAPASAPVNWERDIPASCFIANI